MEAINCCDYLDLLKQIPDASVDSVITDPPFGIGYSNNYTQNQHEVLKGDEAKFSYLELGKEAYRILKDDTAIFIFTGWSEYPEHYKQLESCGFIMKEPVICQKRASGKALALDTPIPTINGWTTMGELKIGDKIFDNNGNICKVNYKSSVLLGSRCYKITFSDGHSIIADADHFWVTETKNDRLQFNKGRTSQSFFLRTTEEIKDDLYVGIINPEKNHTVPITKPLNLENSDLLISPYILGLWLGDGNNHRCAITCDINDIDEIKGYVEGCNGTLGVIRRDNRSNACYVTLCPRIKGLCCRGHEKKVGTKCRECLKLKKSGKELPKTCNVAMQTYLLAKNLICNKHIPKEYLRSSHAQRMELLRGLMDTDGYISKLGECVFTNTNRNIIDGIVELTRSLGYKPLVTTKKTITKLVYNVRFSPLQDDLIFKLKRKLVRQRQCAIKIFRRKIIKIELVKSVPVACIQVNSPSHLYLAGEGFVPTHNTDLYGSFQSNSDWVIFAHKGRFKFKKTELVKNKKAGVVPNIGRKPVPEYKTRFPTSWFGDDYPWSTENSGFQKKNNIHHPTIKGLQFIEWLILLSTNEDDIVVDPFVGSGTTALACERLKRKYIVCDSEDYFCNLTRKRIKEGI